MTIGQLSDNDYFLAAGFLLPAEADLPAVFDPDEPEADLDGVLPLVLEPPDLLDLLLADLVLPDLDDALLDEPLDLPDEPPPLDLVAAPDDLEELVPPLALEPADFEAPPDLGPVLPDLELLPPDLDEAPVDLVELLPPDLDPERADFDELAPPDFALVPEAFGADERFDAFLLDDPDLDPPAEADFDPPLLLLAVLEPDLAELEPDFAPPVDLLPPAVPFDAVLFAPDDLEEEADFAPVALDPDLDPADFDADPPDLPPVDEDLAVELEPLDFAVLELAFPLDAALDPEPPDFAEPLAPDFDPPTAPTTALAVPIAAPAAAPSRIVPATSFTFPNTVSSVPDRLDLELLDEDFPCEPDFFVGITVSFFVSREFPTSIAKLQYYESESL